ncbi:ABC transporter ATP-binding protein [Castellaniella sp.]|uniref:ABC transporter ATP-binding protein n=1 Tax=Castellaniella sp. TaxID=1955812 RepID=UPI00355F301C
MSDYPKPTSGPAGRKNSDRPFIRIDGLRKSYRNKGQESVALSNVTLDIHAGDMVSLVGPSGCGKSTLLKILSGLYEHDGGTLEIHADAQRNFNPGKDVGMVFQQPLLLKWRNILENVMLPADILGLPRSAARVRALELLDMVGLGGQGKKMPYELSGGMQQRAAIARALLHDPSLVLMDEPFGALDALTREKMNLEMLRIWEQSHKTFVVVTHSIQEAVFLGTHCAVLTAGPARMADFFPIALPAPRTLHVKATAEFTAYVSRIYDLLGVA